MGVEERMKLTHDVLYPARAALLLSLQFKGTGSFWQCSPQGLVPGVSVPVDGLGSWVPTLCLWLDTGHLLQNWFARCPRHLASHSSKQCLQWEGCADLASSSLAALQAQPGAWLISTVSQSTVEMQGRLVSTNTCVLTLWFLLSSLAHNNKGWSEIKTLCNLIIKQKTEGKHESNDTVLVSLTGRTGTWLKGFVATKRELEGKQWDNSLEETPSEYKKVPWEIVQRCFIWEVYRRPMENGVID